MLLDAIAKGQQRLDEIDNLPTGLHPLYHEFLRRLASLDRWNMEFAPLIGILSVVKENLTESQIQRLLNVSERIISSSLESLQQFIEVIKSSETEESRQEPEQNRYKLYHQSIVDFLHRKFITINQREHTVIRNSYFLPAEEWHKNIVDFYKGDIRNWNDVTMELFR